MPRLIDACSVEELPLNRVRAIETGGEPIALCHTKDGFFALGNRCPHRGGPLSQGDVLGNELVCPWHLWGFDVRTGFCGGNREIAVPVYRVEVRDGRVLIEEP